MKTRLDMDKIAKGLGAERGARRGRRLIRWLFRGDAAPGGYRGSLPRAFWRRTADGPILDRATTFAARAPNPQAPRRARGESAGARGCKP